MARCARAALIGIVALASARGSAAAPTRPGSGGKMSGVSVKRLGKVVPGERTVRGKPEQVDAAPIVLWAGGEPAAVLLYRSHLDGRDGVEEISPIPESVTGALRGGGSFKIESRVRFPAEGHPEGPVDTLAVRTAVTADLDGDGVDELIVPRTLGGVELARWKGAASRLPGPSGKVSVATYTPVGTQVARLGTRAVVHVLFRREVHDASASAAELARIGAGEPYALVRADAAGLTRLRLELAPVQEVLAVGAINRPGAPGVDELFALYRKDGGEDVWLSRHRPDGGAIGTPRRVYVPIAAGGRWQVTFVPQSRVAVLTSTAAPAIWFLEPEAPVNWAHAVDVGPVVGDAIEAYLGVADGATKPKAVFRHEDGVYAVDAEGRYHTVADGAFVPAKGAVPFHRVSSGVKDDETALVPSAERGDEYLVVRAHEAGLQRVGHDELMKRADQHLDPKFVAGERRDAEPALDDRDSRRDRRMEEERAKRGVTEPIRTLEQWRRLLPDSYAAVVKDRKAGLDAVLSARLFTPVDDPSRLSDGTYRDPAGLRAWLASLASGPALAFEVVRRGAVTRSVEVVAQLKGLSAEAGRSLIDWRSGTASTASTVIVTTLVVPGEKRDAQPGVYLVRAQGGGR
jgi:hypothetical protein